MTIIIPSWTVALLWVALGIVIGVTLAKWWTDAWAIHNRESKPVWIPWRRIPCDQCFKDGEEYARRHR